METEIEETAAADQRAVVSQDIWDTEFEVVEALGMKSTKKSFYSGRTT